MEDEEKWKRVMQTGKNALRYIMMDIQSRCKVTLNWIDASVSGLTMMFQSASNFFSSVFMSLFVGSLPRCAGLFFCVALFLYCRNLEPMWFICVIHFFGLFCVAFPIGLRTVMNILPAFLLPWFNEIEPRPAFFEMLCSIFTPEWLYLLSSGLRPPFFGRCLQQTPIKTLHQVKWKQHTHTHNI